MEGLGPPQEWVGREVRVILQGRVPDRTGRGGAEFDSVYGVLEGANEIGITVEEVQSLGLHEVGAEEDVHTLSFIPWAAIRRIRRQR